MITVNVDRLGLVAKMSSLPADTRVVIERWFEANAHTNTGEMLFIMQSATGYDMRAFTHKHAKAAKRRGWVLIARGL